MENIFGSISGNDQNYEIIRSEKYKEEEREFVNEMWGKWSPYCSDPKHFLKEIRNNYLARVWEIYLGYTFLKNRFELLKPPSSGPDICISGHKKVWIEATSVKPGGGPDKVPKYKPGWVNHSNDEKLILRYTQAVFEKTQKYREYLASRIVGLDDPFVIAINSGEISGSDIADWSEHLVPAFIKSVLPIGDPYFKMQLYTGKVTDTGYHLRDKINKISGSKVDTTFFQKEKSKDIAGLFHSSLPLFKFNMPKRLEDDLKFLHNPMAINPLKVGFFNFGIEYWCENNELQNKDRRRK